MKNKKLNRLFNLVGQATLFILFNATWTSLLLYGLMHTTV